MLESVSAHDPSSRDAPDLATRDAPPVAAGADTLAVGLRVRGLTCVRDDRILFRDLSFAVGPGEVLQVDGRNGSGKTSLLRIVCGLAQPSDGEMFWNGRPLAAGRVEFLSDLAYVGHTHGVKLELTPLENLRVTRALTRARPGVSLEEALERVGLAGFEDAPARALSAGQCRRVALARLLVTQARLWILDEPFTAIDRRGVADVEALVADHTGAGGSVVLTSHHPIRLPGCRVGSVHLVT